MKVVGIDASLTSTGVAAINLDTGVTSVDRIESKPGGASLALRHQRLMSIRRRLAEWTSMADLVVLEGLAFASSTGQATERAGLWWLIVDSLGPTYLPVAVVAPTARAKYATGKGNAKKDAVLAAVIRRYVDVDVSGNDEADALVLAAMGARHLGQPIDDMPKVNLEAMGKVEWPTA